MVRNLPESFLYERLPEAVVSLDERGLIAAVVGGVQDRLDDLRSYSRKLAYLLDPYRLPDPENNVVLCELTSEQGVVYTRSLDFQPDVPKPDDFPGLTRWAAKELNLKPEEVANARYGRDLQRLVDANTLAYLAETIGAVLYQTQLATAADARQVVATYFPRLKIKGTAKSFEVLGRILGFDDLAFVPLWGRLSPRVPNDPGALGNDPDFAPTPEYWPTQDLGPAYNPHLMRDGPFFTWAGTASNGTGASDYYLQVVNGFNPWVEMVLLDRVVSPLVLSEDWGFSEAGGTLTPPVTHGTASHIPVGVYTLSNGAAHAQAYVDPVGSSFRLRAIAEGESWNGLQVSVYESGSGSRVLEVADRLSSIKYRTSYFDLHATTDWDQAGDVFGERSVRANRDLQANPGLVGPQASSPYRPWLDGSISTGSLVGDWLTRTLYQPPVVIEGRAQASAGDRELPYEAIEAAGLQVAATTEEVRPATRFPRTTSSGLLIQDEAHYACYLSRALLFDTSTGALVYSGSHPHTPLPSYRADITVEPPPILKITWPSDPGRPYEVRATLDQRTFTVIGLPYGDQGLVTQFLVAVTGPYNFFYVFDIPTGTQVATKATLAPGEVFKSNSEIDPNNSQLGHYRYRDQTITNLEMVGTYNFQSGTYWFKFEGGAPVNAEVYALWTTTDTGTIRDEPVYTDKINDNVACQERPEDDPAKSEGYPELCDDYPWLRSVLGGGERLEASSSLVDQEKVVVQVVSETTAVYDQSGVAFDLWVIPSGTGAMTAYGTASPPRAVPELRPTDNLYQPGAVAVGWRGALRDLATYTLEERQLLNKQTDPALLFKPGSTLHRVGLVQGVLVADPEGFFQPIHRDSLCGWYPLSEHPMDNLWATDHVLEAGRLVFTGVRPEDRLWEDAIGYHLRLRPGAHALAGIYRDATDEFSVSFRARAVPVAVGTALTLFEHGPLSIDLAPTTGALTAYCRHSGGGRLAIGTALVTSWSFITLRKTAGLAAFGVNGVESQLLESFAPFTEDDTDLKLAAGAGDVRLHDLRLWKACKSATELETLRNFQPTPVHTLYPPTWIQAPGTFDRYGLRVLPNGWVVPGAMPPWVRRAPEIQVISYESSGSYVGHARQKEVGLGGGITEPADVMADPAVKLGFVFPPPQALGVYLTAGRHGVLPSAAGLWHTTGNTFPQHVELSGGYTVDGSNAVMVTAGAPLFWPETLVKTNAGVDAVWVKGEDDWVYRVSLSGSVPATLSATKAWARHRTDQETTVNPAYKAIADTGTYWDGTFSGTERVEGGRVEFTGPGPVTRFVYMGSLSDAEAFTGAATVLRDGAGTGIRVKATGSEAGVPYQGSVDGPLSPPWWLYRHVQTLEPAPNAWVNWVYGGVDRDPTQFGNQILLHPEVPRMVAALDGNGQLDFENKSSLKPGRYRLTLDVGNIGTVDSGFDGFQTELSINGAPWVPARLLAGHTGYNPRAAEVLDFEVEAAAPAASPWLLTLRWTNAYNDPQRGVKRQLVVYGYLIERLQSELYKVTVPGPVLSYVTPHPGTHDPNTTGGWLRSLTNSGLLAGDRHEVHVRPMNDSGTQSLPLAELLTGSTNERREDILVRSMSGLALPPDETEPALPAFDGGLVDGPGSFPVPLWFWTGGLSPGEAEVRVKMPFDTKLRLAYSTRADFLGALYTPEVEASKSLNNCVARFHLAGLAPWTPYFYAVEVAGMLSLNKAGRFTAPGASAHSFKFALGSASRNARGDTPNNVASNKIVYDAIRNQSPLFFLHAGDLHYNHVATDSEVLHQDALDAIFSSSGSYAFQGPYLTNIGSGRQEQLWREVPVVWTWNDHDYGASDSDRTNPSSRAARVVYRQYVPHASLQAAGAPDAPIYQSFRVGRCVFILSDNRSERSPKGDTDNATKVIYSSSQLAWWKTQVLAASRDPNIQFIFWVNPSPWIGPASAGLDSWQGYDTQRQEIVAWLGANTVTKLFILSGDMTACALDDGTNAPGRLPVFHAGPLDQTTNTDNRGGTYLTGPYPATTGSVATQFGLVEVVDDGVAPATVTFKGLDQTGAVLTGAGGLMQLTLTPQSSPKP